MKKILVTLVVTLLLATQAYACGQGRVRGGLKRVGQRIVHPLGR